MGPLSCLFLSEIIPRLTKVNHLTETSNRPRTHVTTPGWPWTHTMESCTTTHMSAYSTSRVKLDIFAFLFSSQPKPTSINRSILDPRGRGAVHGWRGPKGAEISWTWWGPRCLARGWVLWRFGFAWVLLGRWERVWVLEWDLEWRGSGVL